MEQQSTTEVLSDDVLEVLVESKMLMSELYKVKQALVKFRLGAVNYQRAVDFMEAPINNAGLFESLDPDTKRQLEELDRAKSIEFARDLLQLETSGNEDMYLKDWAENIAKHKYPEDTILTVLDDQEKLAIIGSILINMSNDEEAQNNEYLTMYDEACWDVDDKVTGIYSQITGQDDIDKIEVDDTSFGIFFHDSLFDNERDEVIDDPNINIIKAMEKISNMSAASVVISVVDDELRIQNEPANQKIQLEEIRSALRPIPKIIEELEKELTV